MEGIQSTRQVLPAFHFRRPIQSIPLDDLLTITADTLLESLVSTLKDHAKRFQSHIEQQKAIYSKYIKTVSEIQTVKSSTKVIKKPCTNTNNNKSCKSPATFEVKTYHLEVNKDVEKEALELKNEAYSYFYTTIDSRISTQILLAIGKIKSILLHFENSSNKKERERLLQLAWSCIEFLWQELKMTTTYPPVKTFLNQICDIMKNMIPGNNYSMNRLIQLFDHDPESIEYLYLLFNPNIIFLNTNTESSSSNLFIQRYQQITRIILKTSSVSTAQKYLVQSFDVATWAKTATAKNELNRQEIYLAACDYIERSFINDNSDNNDTKNNNTSHSLSMIYSSQIMELMQSFLIGQKEINQGEILYILHILLNMMASVVNIYLKEKNHRYHHLQNDLNDILDKFTASLTIHPLQDIFILWKSSSLPKLGLTLVNDADHILDVLSTIITQQCSLHHGNAFDVYGSVSTSISRLILNLMLDDSANLSFELAVKMFSLFWQPFDQQQTSNNNDQQSEQVAINYTDDGKDDDTIQYIIQSFELVLKHLIHANGEDNEKEILIKTFTFYHHDIFNQVDFKFQHYFYTIMHTIHWHSLPINLHNDDDDFLDILCKSVLYLITNNNNNSNYKKNIGQYLKFVYIFIQQTVLFQINNNNKKNNQLQDIMTHHQIITYIKLTFIILIYTDSIWPNNDDCIQKVEILWHPLSSTINHIQLSANDIHDIVSTTQIYSNSNWTTTLDKSISNVFDHSNKNNSRHEMNNGDCLSVCIKWMQTLTIKDDTTKKDFDKFKEFGNFILPLLANIKNENTLQHWLKYLLDQADTFIDDNDNNNQKYINWFQLLISNLLIDVNDDVNDDDDDEHRQYNDKLKKIAINTFYEFISSSRSNTAFAFFVASIPPILNNSSPKISNIKMINNKLLFMERCVERYMSLEKDHNKVWIRIGSIMYDIWHDYTKNVTTNDDDNRLTNYINYCVQYCMELSCFLVIRAYCQGKLQQLYNTTTSQNKNNDINIDYHVSEEIAAILSLIHLQPEMTTDLKQIQKFVELIQLYTLLFSKHKNQQQALDLWVPSLVSLSKTCIRWNATEPLSLYHQELSLSTSSFQNDHKKNKNNDHHHIKNDSNIFWNIFTKLLDIYLSKRLMKIGIPSFKEDDKNNQSWMNELNNLKSDKNYKQFEKLISFGIEAINDDDRWTLWDLYNFIENIMNFI